MSRDTNNRPHPRWLAVRDRLGVDSDAQIAREMGVSRERVRQVRVRLGIDKPPKPVSKAYKWSRESARADLVAYLRGEKDR